MKNYRVSNILTLAALCATSTNAIYAAKGGSRPNVLLIMADDMGSECIGVNGSSYSTPNIDALAEAGINYTNCHSQPLSTPSRVELMTGKYNNRNYVGFGELEYNQRTFANAARDAGYRTCVAGKWQLGSKAGLPDHFGFDTHCLWQYTQPKHKGERYARALYELDGECMPRDIDTYGPDVYSDFVCDFMTKPSDAPFFVYYPMALVHSPFFSTPDSDDWSDEQQREVDKMIHFSDMVSYTDKIIGKIVATLKENDLYDNTLIIFLGDNGTHRTVKTKMEDGTTIQGGKKGTLRNGTSVPMVVAWGDKIKGGETNENLVDFTDFYITLRDLFGGDKSKDHNLDGITLLPQFLGEKSELRKYSFSHYPMQNMASRYVRFAQSVDYKLYQNGEFYNTRTDAGELSDIKLEMASDAENDIRAELQHHLDSYPLGSEIIEGETTLVNHKYAVNDGVANKAGKTNKAKKKK